MKTTLLLCLVVLCGSQAHAQVVPPTCQLTFANEDPVIAELGQGENQRDRQQTVLVAQSTGWTTGGEGARIEVDYQTSLKNSSQVVAYIRKMVPFTVTGGGNTIQVPEMNTVRRRYWMNLDDELTIMGINGEKIAGVRCVNP